MKLITKYNSLLKVILSLAVLSTFMSILRIEIEGVRLNTTQLICLLLSFLLAFRSILFRKRLVLFIDHTSIFIYLYLISNLFSSFVFSTDIITSIKGCVVIFSYVFVYMIVRWTIKLIDDVPSAVGNLLKYNFWFAFFGLVSMVVAFMSQRKMPGVTFDHIAQSGFDQLTGSVSVYSVNVGRA